MLHIDVGVLNPLFYDKVMKKILLHFLGFIGILILAFSWIILNPKPAFAQINTINYNNITIPG
jgi:hypothetical protein